MKFSIKDFFGKCDQIRKLHLLKKSLMENFIFCAELGEKEANLYSDKFSQPIREMFLSIDTENEFIL